MADKWIQKAIKHPGSLRRTVNTMRRKKGEKPLKSSENIPNSDLNYLGEHGSGKTKKRVNLARTLKKLHR